MIGLLEFGFQTKPTFPLRCPKGPRAFKPSQVIPQIKLESSLFAQLNWTEVFAWLSTSSKALASFAISMGVKTPSSKITRISHTLSIDLSQGTIPNQCRHGYLMLDLLFCGTWEDLITWQCFTSVLELLLGSYVLNGLVGDNAQNLDFLSDYLVQGLFCSQGQVSGGTRLVSCTTGPLHICATSFRLLDLKTSHSVLICSVHNRLVPVRQLILVRKTSSLCNVFGAQVHTGLVQCASLQKPRPRNKLSMQPVQ